MKNLTPFLLLLMFLFSCSGKQNEDPRSKTIIVSIAPYKYFAEKIAGDTLKVEVIVPAGGSPHSFEPSARKVLETGKADIWFRIGESFEAKALRALKGYNPRLTVIDMREGIPLLDQEGTCQHIDCQDPHIWLSPRLVKEQAETIAHALIDVYPEHKDLYQKALRQFQKELDDLDLEISGILHPLKNRTLVVSHPAYAYFCRDYRLRQLPIEFEGKDPTPQQLTQVLNEAKEIGATTVFVQTQHIGKGARLVAKELGANVVELDPLAVDYPENMIKMAKSFAAQ